MKLSPWWTTLDLQHWLRFQSILGIKPAVSEVTGNTEDGQWCWEVLSPTCIHGNVWALSLYNHSSPRNLQGSFFTLCSPYWDTWDACRIYLLAALHSNQTTASEYNSDEREWLHLFHSWTPEWFLILSKLLLCVKLPEGKVISDLLLISYGSN